MYNTNLPTRAELPSSKQLIKSTFIALLTAAVLLVTTVLPAEYGIDPTGIGQVLGLKKMGEIKTSLAKEAAQSTNQANAQPAAQVTASKLAEPQTAPIVSKPTNKTDAVEKSDELTFTLKPGETAEIKLDMSKDAKVTYQWVVSGGAVNFDGHGDPINPPKGFYHGYGKGKQSMGDKGTLIAAFDGKHGWFWRNRSTENSSIKLTTKGEYSAFKRLL